MKHKIIFIVFSVLVIVLMLWTVNGVCISASIILRLFQRRSSMLAILKFQVRLGSR